jgi:hypothetical protein
MSWGSWGSCLQLERAGDGGVRVAVAKGRAVGGRQYGNSGTLEGRHLEDWHTKSHSLPGPEIKLAGEVGIYLSFLLPVLSLHHHQPHLIGVSWSELNVRCLLSHKMLTSMEQGFAHHV